MKRKTNAYLEEAIFLAKKKNLIDIASALAAPARQETKINVEAIEKSGKVDRIACLQYSMRSSSGRWNPLMVTARSKRSAAPMM